MDTACENSKGDLETVKKDQVFEAADGAGARLIELGKAVAVEATSVAATSPEETEVTAGKTKKGSNQ